MGSSASSRVKDDSNCSDQARRQVLLQRKVTVDILDRLARRLPQPTNPLGKTLKLENDAEKILAWQANLNYLQEWKKSKRDEATIGNLINLLKATGHKEDEYECLFNISREPRNVSTATDVTAEPDEAPSQTNTQPNPNYERFVAKEKDSNTTKSKIPTSVETIFLPHDHKMQERDTTNFNELANQEKYADYEYFSPSPERSLTSSTNMQVQPIDKPLFLTEGRLYSDTSEDANHPWLDFRNWDNVTKSWDFINKTETRKEKMGNYFPGIAVLNEVVVVSDTEKNMLHYFDESGHLLKSHSTGKLKPGGMCKVNSETIAVCCGHMVAIWSSKGRLLRQFGCGIFKWCRGICMNRDNRFVVSDVEQNDVTIHSGSGRLITSLNVTKQCKFTTPYHIAANHMSQILVSDSTNSSIWVFDKNGIFMNKFGHFGEQDEHIKIPMGLTTDCSGNVLICDYGNNRISIYNHNGWFLKHVLTKAHIKRPVTVGVIGRQRVLVSMMNDNPLRVFEFG